MWKRKILITLCLILLLPIHAYAVEPRATVNQPTLNFSRSTALCEFRITDLGKSIQVTMELWQGTTLVDSWTASGTHIVTLEKTCVVVRGQTYTLRVSGTSDGVSFGNTSVVKYCP